MDTLISVSFPTGVKEWVVYISATFYKVGRRAVARRTPAAFVIPKQQHDPAAARKSFGLLGMGERVNMLGGDLEIDSQPGRGTRIAATFPLAGEAQP